MIMCSVLHVFRVLLIFFFFQAEDGIRDGRVTGVQTCALPIFVGDGPLAASIARDNPDAELLGWRTRDQIASLIASARMVVSPTRSRETFGLVPLEALMSGVPVVLSGSFPTSDELSRRDLAVVCEPLDEQDRGGKAHRWWEKR